MGQCVQCAGCRIRASLQKHVQLKICGAAMHAHSATDKSAHTVHRQAVAVVGLRRRAGRRRSAALPGLRVDAEQAGAFLPVASARVQLPCSSRVNIAGFE